jgi:hypothetical protein
VHLGPALVADEQPFEVVQPGEGALDDPTPKHKPRKRNTTKPTIKRSSAKR